MLFSNHRSYCTAALLLLWLGGFSQDPAWAEAGWKAGVAKVKITPTEPIWLAGYGSRDRPSGKVLQDIYAKALALQDESGAVSVLVSTDLLGFNRTMSEEVFEKARQRFGLTRDRLVINASHTHSGPATEQVLRPAYSMSDENEAVVRRYTEDLLEKTVSVIARAVQNLEPADLEFEQGLAGFAVNRRRARKGKRHLPAPVDHDVPVLAVRTSKGGLKAIVFGYACHATVLSGYEINGDWPGFAQESLERTHSGAVALFVNGCGADANPLPRRSEDLARMYGEILAIAVNQVLDKEMNPVLGPLKTAFQRVDIPFQTPPTRSELEKRVASEEGSLRRHAEHLLAILDREGRIRDFYPYPIQVWSFGKGLTFIHLAGEVVVDYALRFKAEYGWDDVWVTGYSNEVFAYIPSLRVLKEGGYEGGGAMIPYGQPGPFRAAVEEIIAEKVDELVRLTSQQSGDE